MVSHPAKWMMYRRGEQTDGHTLRMAVREINGKHQAGTDELLPFSLIRSVGSFSPFLSVYPLFFSPPVHITVLWPFLFICFHFFSPSFFHINSNVQ